MSATAKEASNSESDHQLNTLTDIVRIVGETRSAVEVIDRKVDRLEQKVDQQSSDISELKADTAELKADTRQRRVESRQRRVESRQRRNQRNFKAHPVQTSQLRGAAIGSGANLIFCSCLLKYDVSRICYSAI